MKIMKIFDIYAHADSGLKDTTVNPAFLASNGGSFKIMRTTPLRCPFNFINY